MTAGCVGSQQHPVFGWNPNLVRSQVPDVLRTAQSRPHIGSFVTLCPTPLRPVQDVLRLKTERPSN
jgi:hypothetical protein